MIRTENHLGVVEISEEYFANLVGNATSSCFGVAGMANASAVQGLFSIIRKNTDAIDKGVQVHNEAGGLVIDLHIEVSYGVNISAIVQSIVNKVRYTVEEATGFEVKKVNIFVDSMKTE